MNRENNNRNSSVSEITLNVRIRDIALVAVIAGSLGYITGAVLPHLFFVEHINVALGMFVFFGMLFLVGFILLFFEPILFPYRAHSWISIEQNNIADTADDNENVSHEESIQVPPEPVENACVPKAKDSMSNLYTLQNAEIAKLGLSDQENTIANLLLQGYKNKEIAAQIYLSESGVKYHVHNIYEKAHVNSRHDLKKLIWCNMGLDKTPEVTEQACACPTAPR